MQYPYSDNDMVYDFNAHRYVLTPDCVKRELGIDLNGSGNTADDINPSAYALRALNRISRQVYNFIYESVWDVSEWEKLLAVTPSVRDKLKEMMLSQLEYISAAGYTPNMSGINRANGQVIDINLIRGRAKISNEVEQIADQPVREWGVSMRYAGQIYFCCQPDWRW